MKPNPNEIIQAIEEDRNVGFCISCGHEHDGIEPDAREYECENCGANKVYGAMELIIMLVP